MGNIQFRIAAKTDVGCVRSNNEDNFQASADLSVAPMRWVNNETCSLGSNGALLVVADGMGGMNAGEVASEIAIETVRAHFAPENISPTMLADRYAIERFMNQAIVDADRRIKDVSKDRPETRGMGTTIVVAWLVAGKLYVSWCGDSRAYVYNPVAGLHQISKDHSYVQSLVDKGAISKEDAFDYPDSNIITRCLSDATAKAKPESLLRPYEVCDNDIVLLCTDGLNGMIRDNEIENILRNNAHDMDVCTDELIAAAREAAGADNITVAVCQVLGGGAVSDKAAFLEFDRRLAGNAAVDSSVGAAQGGNRDEDTDRATFVSPKLNYTVLALATALVAALVVIAVLLFRPKPSPTPQPTDVTETTDVKRQVGTQTIVAVDGSTFRLERETGDPMVGDIASPNGVYKLANGLLVSVIDGKVYSVERLPESMNTEDSQNEEKAKEVLKRVVDNNTKDKGDNKNQDKDKNKNKNKHSGDNLDKGKEGVPDTDPSGNGQDSDEDVLTLVTKGKGGEKDGKKKSDPTLTPVEHTVKDGESLSTIAKKYGVTVDELKKINGLSKDNIQAGQKLKIPTKKQAKKKKQ